MPDRSVAVRIAVKDVEAARARLRQLGEAGEAELARIETGARRADKAFHDFDAHTGRGSGIRNLRGGLGNLGLQLQDVVVQLQAGTDASIVFAQQGAQIAGAFGPAGAAIGVVIALVGSLGGALFAMAGDTEDAAAAAARATERFDQLREIMGQLRGEVETTSSALEASARIIVEQVTNDLERAEAKVEDIRDRMSEAAEAIRGGLLGGLLSDREVEIAAQQQFQGELGPAVERARELRKELTLLQAETDAYGDRFSRPLLQTAPEVFKHIAEQEKAAADEAKRLAAEQDRAAAAAERAAAARQRTADKVLNDLKRQAQAIDREAAQLDAADQRKAEQFAEQRRRELEREADQAARLAAAPFENALQGIQDTFTSTFEQIYSGGVDSFSDLAEAAKGIFVRLAAELTTLQLFRGVTGAGALGFGAVPGAAGAGPISLSQAITGVPAGQPVGAGGFNFGTTLAGVGLGVGAGATVASLTGADQTAGLIGSTTGAIAGAVLGNILLPGVGGIIGGALGGAAGGGIASLFGGGDEDKVQGSFGGRLGHANFTGDRAISDLVKKVDQGILDLLDTREEAIVGGLSLGGDTISVKGGLSSSDIANIAAKRIKPVAKALGFRGGQIAQGDPEQQLQNLQSALEVKRAVEELVGSVGTFDRQIEDLQIQFDELSSKAKRFGVATDGMAEALEDAKADLAEQQRAQLAGLVDPFDQLLDQVEAVRKQAEFIGLSPAEQFRATQSEFERIAQEALAGSITDIQGFGPAAQALIQQAGAFGASPAIADALDRVTSVATRLEANITGARDQAEASAGIQDEVARARVEIVDSLAELKDQVAKMAQQLRRGT